MKIIIISYDNAVFSWVFMDYKSFIAVDTDDILMKP